MSPFSPYAALAGGALIGAAASLLLLVQGRVAGISGIVDGALAEAGKNQSWRVPFLLGLVVTGFVASRFVPGAVGPAVAGLLPVAVAGAFVGFGTRLGNGCTSGHGVSGLSRLSVRSLVATVTFILAGMLTAYLLLHVRGAA
jgi:uncharacterized protein